MASREAGDGPRPGTLSRRVRDAGPSIGENWPACAGDDVLSCQVDRFLLARRERPGGTVQQARQGWEPIPIRGALRPHYRCGLHGTAATALCGGATESWVGATEPRDGSGLCHCPDAAAVTFAGDPRRGGAFLRLLGKGNFSRTNPCRKASGRVVRFLGLGRRIDRAAASAHFAGHPGEPVILSGHAAIAAAKPAGRDPGAPVPARRTVMEIATY